MACIRLCLGGFQGHGSLTGGSLDPRTGERADTLDEVRSSGSIEWMGFDHGAREIKR